MMTLVRWYPRPGIQVTRHDMSRLAKELVRDAQHDGRGVRRGVWLPAVDLTEGDEVFTLKAELPGFSKDDVQVEIQDNTLTLTGERTREADIKGSQYHRM